MDRMIKYYHRYPHHLKCLAILLSGTSFLQFIRVNTISLTLRLSSSIKGCYYTRDTKLSSHSRYAYLV